MQPRKSNPEETKAEGTKPSALQRHSHFKLSPLAQHVVDHADEPESRTDRALRKLCCSVQ